MSQRNFPKRAMVLAAGLGLRLRPITNRLPKPLVEVAGRALIDRTLDSLAAADIESVVVNTHYLADKIKDHLAPRQKPKITLTYEENLLDTGGSVTASLDQLGPGPFLAANADVIILDGARPTWRRLMEAWDDGAMDGLLLLQRTVTAFGYDGRGDFVADQNGLLRRRHPWEVAPFLFAGAQILHPRLFEDAPDAPFSLNRLYDRAIENERLYGIIHDGAFLHIGTPAALAGAERHIKYNL